MREDILVKIIEMLGTFAFAISGIRHAAAKHFDWFGGYVCGIAVAIGGGTIRDVMLGVTPFWMTTPVYMVCTAVALFTVAFFGRWMEPLKNAWMVFDTLGLALFTIAGIQKSLLLEQPFWVAVIMGCITGAAGGVIRDVLLNTEPVIFRKEIYAMACVAGGLAYWGTIAMGMPAEAAAMVSFTATCLIRFIAVRYHVSLPILHDEPSQHKGHDAAKATALVVFLSAAPPFAAIPAQASAPPKQKAARQRFHRELPPGNYSGICSIGGGRYAVVDDKAAEDGFYIFRLDIDSGSGRIRSAANEGYRSSGQPNRDMEGVCFRPSSQTLFISGEKDNEVYEYTLDGRRTGRRLAMPPEYAKAGRNFGLEALAYDSAAHLFYTTTERPLPGDTLLRIQTFGDDLNPRRQYLYRSDAPISKKHFHGVSELCVLPDGRLLVLERQLRIPRLKVGARSTVRVYETTPAGNAVLEKHLLKEYKGSITLASRSFANCEGMCLPSPNLLLLLADSQNRYRNVLRDWLLTVKM